MTWCLVRKLLRDARLALVVIALLLAAFQCLWAKVSERISGAIITSLQKIGVTVADIKNVVFEGPGKIIETLMGGEMIHIDRAQDMLSVGCVHPLIQAIFCIWAVGRASAAIAGELDRGTMELLLAQPLARARLVLAHFIVDLITIPILCLSLWAGIWLGTWLVGLWDAQRPDMRVDPWAFGPSLMNMAVLLFALSGYTMWLSACGRFRGRVLGWAVLLTLVQFMVNVVGQLWDVLAPLRPFTVFYYYQPQQIILNGDWADDVHVWQRLGVLLAVGAVGYLGALWTFSRRDLPAPL
jgi:ABC-2 type transport system permease protein